MLETFELHGSVSFQLGWEDADPSFLEDSWTNPSETFEQFHMEPYMEETKPFLGNTKLSSQSSMFHAYPQGQLQRTKTHVKPKILPKLSTQMLTGTPRGNEFQSDGGQHPCTYRHCHRRYPTAEELQFHINSFHGAQAVVCSVCGKTFGSKRGLDFHMSNHTGQYRFWCGACKKGFNRIEKWQMHQNKHSGQGFSCLVCNKIFSHHSILQRHLQSVHGK